MLTTRIGDNSEMVITGDLKQTDRSIDNGLLDIMNKIKDYKSRSDLLDGGIGIEMVEMKYSDIERSPIVSRILEIYNDKRDGGASRDDASRHDIDSDHIKDNNNTTTTLTSTFVTSTVVEKKINDDAALIPLSDISKRFRPPTESYGNVNLIF
jgi:hypothetical protein